ncbi:MAG: hypothetical protein CMK09_14695 [Ponticaulis sp.]|nr:hypothetical protein [Ponticaulis sp.]|tara:strand:- start:2275 stop:3018 length:744 start_codon:yes stop_codon:yes gene_type:complete
MKWVGYVFLTVLVTLTALVVTLPAEFVMQRLVRSEPAIRYAQANGTVWNGSVHGIQYDQQSIGSARIETDWLSIFSGKLSSLVRINDGVVNGRGRVSAGLTGQIEIEDLRLSGSTVELTNIRKEIRDLAGEYTLSIRNATLWDGRCRSASGTVWTDLLTKMDRTVDWTGPELTGPVSCRDGRFVLTLTGETPGQETVDATLEIGLDATGAFEAEVTNAQQETGRALTLIGFLNSDDGTFVYQHSLPG